MKVISVSLVIAVLLCALWADDRRTFVEAAPNPGFLDKLFGLSSYNGGGGGRGYYSNGGYSSDYRQYGGGGGGSGRRQKQGRSYSDICRVITPDAYARPGGRVFPAQPFCPHG